MRLAGRVLVAGLTVLFASVSFAQTIDPSGILVGGGTSTPILSTTFDLTFGACPSGLAGSCFNGINESKVTFLNVDAVINFMSSVPVTMDNTTCGFTATGFNQEYTACTVKNVTFNGATNTGTLEILWFNGSIPSTTPILLATGDPTPDFFIDVKGVTPTGGTATANVPEPGTMALFLTGIAALVARRRRDAHESRS